MDEEADLTRGRVVAGAGSYTSRQGSVYAPGISAETVGAKAVFIGVRNETALQESVLTGLPFALRAPA